MWDGRQALPVFDVSASRRDTVGPLLDLTSVGTTFSEETPLSLQAAPEHTRLEVTFHDDRERLLVLWRMIVPVAIHRPASTQNDALSGT